MRLDENLSYIFEQVEERVVRTVDGLDAEALAWRPDAEANSVAWLIWHLTRVQDSHVADVADREQVWDSGWAQRFGLPQDYTDTGYGHSSQQVGQIAPDSPGVLVDYQREVRRFVADFLAGQNEQDFDRIVDESYDPPVSLGVRMASVLGDSLQHVGQAAYVRGLFERA